MKTEIYTIGVYGSTEETFFSKLIEAQIDLFVDIRQRRGVRGNQYKYVNSNYLQAKLKELGIGYLYIKDLSPTKEIRMKQKEADKVIGETKQKRTKLGSVFVHEYVHQILEEYDIEALMRTIESDGYNQIVFFCVEEKAEACHRSLVVNRIHEIYSYSITNL